jgi:hypothetical protein
MCRRRSDAMKKLVKIGTLAFVLLFVLSGVGLATVTPPDSGLEGFTPFAVYNYNEDAPATLVAYVWSNIYETGDSITVNGVTTGLLRYEYYIQNLFVTRYRQVTISSLVQPFIAGVDNDSAIGTATFGGGIDGIPAVQTGDDFATFSFTVLPYDLPDVFPIPPGLERQEYLEVGALSKLFYIDMPYDPGLPVDDEGNPIYNFESVDGGFEGEAQIVIGVPNGNGGSAEFEPVPEPGTLFLLGSGLLGTALGLRRRNKKT